METREDFYPNYSAYLGPSSKVRVPREVYDQMLGPGGSLVGGDVQQTIDKLMEPLADIPQVEASTRLRRRDDRFFAESVDVRLGAQWSKSNALHPTGRPLSGHSRRVGRRSGRQQCADCVGNPSAHESG